MKDEKIPTLSDLPQPPADAVFSLQKVERITMPHPFMIMPGHVAYAADRCGGMLTRKAIRDSGVRCGWTTRGDLGRNERCQLPFDQHETSLTLFINLPQNKDLNSVTGLGKYLSDNKEQFVALGIQGFAFPRGGQ